MKNHTIRLVVILGAVAISGILFIQYYLVKSAFDNEERKFNQTTHIALIEVMKRLLNEKQLKMPNQNPVIQVSSDYFVVNVNDEIDSDVLEFYLKSEFSKYNINTAFEYGIYDCSSDKMVYGNYINPGIIEAQIEPTLRWPRQNDLIYYFAIRFPEKQSLILSNLQIWGFFILLAVIAILFFGYAIFVILSQKRLSEVHKDFINNITHELKTPIASIKIASDYLKGFPLLVNDHRTNNYIGLINEQNERLNTLVDNVLLSSKVEKKSMELNIKVLDLKVLIYKLVPLYNIKLEGTSELNIEASGEKYPIKADELHLTNLLNNLVDNAIKYGKGEKEIKFRLKREGNLTTLAISDNGIGIEKEHHKKVLKKFYRVPTGNVHTTKGFGLGLYYVKNICDRHGWKLNLVSTHGEGTTVTITMRNYEA